MAAPVGGRLFWAGEATIYKWVGSEKGGQTRRYSDAEAGAAGVLRKQLLGSFICKRVGVGCGWSWVGSAAPRKRTTGDLVKADMQWQRGINLARGS